MSYHSSHHPQEVLLAQFSLYVYKCGLKPDSFNFFISSTYFGGFVFSFPLDRAGGGGGGLVQWLKLPVGKLDIAGSSPALGFKFQRHT